jgi:hypothetical protein
MNGFMCPSKPRLLFGFDIQNPPNEWQSIHSKTTGQSVGYLNPATGQMSRFNHKEAAKLIQQWYRSQSFSDFKMKDLKTLVKAIRFHQVSSSILYMFYILNALG